MRPMTENTTDMQQRTSARERLLDAAERLFDARGFHATGVDRIIEEAGVARMTLYNQFGSKDDLIAAVIRRKDAHARDELIREQERLDADPRARLDALFASRERWLRGDRFLGCIFASAAAEFASAPHPAAEPCAEHKRFVREYIRALCVQAGAARPDALADQLMLLLDGAVSLRETEGDTRWGSAARNAASTLMDAALGVDASGR